MLIGLDGATWTLLGPWARAGRLPHLAALMARGAWGTLRATVPALTLPSWSSFLTGKNPGGHGIFAFWRLAPGSYEPGGLANASDLRSATLWDVLGRAGKTVGVINVPPSYPIRRVNGYVVSCMLTPPGEAFTEPPEVAAELGPYVIDRKAPRGLRADPATFLPRSLEYLEALREQEHLRVEATLRVMERRPTDVACVVFYAPDRIQHNFWDEITGDGQQGPASVSVREAAATVYRTLDDAIGRLVAAAGPEATIILASDHGFAPKPARSVRINRWLADHGFLAQRSFWSLRRKVVRRLPRRSWRARYDTIDYIQLNRARSRAWSETIDYGTAAIWVHVRGRYPLGCVSPGAEYEAVRRGIQEGLSNLRDETGGPVFRGVYRREELYSGPYMNEAPDLVAVCEPEFGVVNQSLRRDLRADAIFGPFAEAGFTGTHAPGGIYLFAGPAIAPLGCHQDYPIEAIAPTVLRLLDLPIPRSMDGPVCESLLREGFRASHPVRFADDADDRSWEQPGWRSGADEAKVADHLRALGYLE